MEFYGEEKALWEKVEPYIVNCQLVPDAPPEIVEAAERLREIAWDLSRMQ